MIALVSLSLAGLFSMVSGIFNINARLVAWILVFVLVGAASLLLSGQDIVFSIESISSMVDFDRYALSYSGLIIVLTSVVLLMSEHFLGSISKYQGEFLSLVVFSSVGMLCMVSFVDLSMLFVGIEIMSVPLYILAGSKKNNLLSNESSLKYFLMGAFTTGILLMGITLVYGATQSFNLYKIAEVLNSGVDQPLLILGLMFLLFAFCFKVSAFPFHFWTPDVYQGAPTWVTSFMSTVVKVAGIGAFFRLFSMISTSNGLPQNIQLSIAVIAAVTITIGTISAVFQSNIKRILAYSSVSHAGYMVILVVFSNNVYQSSIFYYCFAYGVSSLALFGVLMAVESKVSISDMKVFNGFSKKNSFLAFVAVVSLVSMAGIPPTAGFIGKFSVLKVAVQEGYVWLAIVGVVNAVVAIYYYFKLLISMYFKPADENAAIEVNSSIVYNFVLILLVVAIIGGGVFADFIFDKI